MKLKPLVAAALLAAAAPAFANIVLPSTGDSELVFVIRDNTAGTQISFALDLGLTMNSFLVAGQQEVGYHQEWNLTGDANFASFLSQTNPSAYEWAVVGGDTTGGNAAGGLRWFTTAGANVTAANVGTMTNAQISTGLPLLGQFFVVVNQSGTHPAATSNGSSVNNIIDAGLSYYGEPGGTGPNLNTNAPFSNTNAVGASSSFYALARSGLQGTSLVTVDQFDNATGLGVFSLIQTASGYQLSYTLAGPVAEVPEPGGLAMLLAGFTAMGFVSRRRRSGR